MHQPIERIVHTTAFAYFHNSSYIGEGSRLVVQERKGKEMFYLMTHSTYFIYGYMALDIW